MRNKKRFVLARLTFLWISFVLLTSANFVPAQIAENVNSRPTEFGASLRKNVGKKKKKDFLPKRFAGFAPANEDVVRIETNLIVNEILVFDKNNKNVPDLRKEDFVVREDGDLQRIEAFSRGDDELFPRSIVLIIDYSNSQLPYIKTSVEAAKILVDKLYPNDKMAIVTDDVELIQDFTRDKNLLKEKLDSLKRSALAGNTGKSRQYCALMAVLNEMFDEEHRRPVIIFQTDGDELARLNGYSAFFPATDFEMINFGFKDVLKTTEEKRAVIYTIIPGARMLGVSKKEKLIKAKAVWLENEKAIADLRQTFFAPEKIKIREDFLNQWAELRVRQQTAIEKIASFTGGSTEFLERPEQAEDIYTKILADMRRRYVIGYYPSNQIRDGKTRQVKIEVRGRADYNVWGRKTYILPEADR